MVTKKFLPKRKEKKIPPKLTDASPCFTLIDALEELQLLFLPFQLLNEHYLSA